MEEKVLTPENPELAPNHTVQFTATNIASHPDDAEIMTDGGKHDFDKTHHIYWDSKGDLQEMPFAEYEFDAGAEECFETVNHKCHDMAGGPESIHVGEVMDKQYLVFVSCYSCNHDHWGEKIPLTEKALYEFARSQAIVRVAQGSEQIYCRSIGTTPHRPTVRWDTVVLKCPRGTGDHINMEVNGGGSKLEDEQKLIHPHRCTPHDINTYNLQAPTLESVHPVVPEGAFHGDTVVTTKDVINVTIFGSDGAIAGPEHHPTQDIV